MAEHEKIRQFTLFSVERNEITPTMKIKRKKVAEKFGQAIESMYQPPKEN
ncbi:MAG: hypothetical protein K9K81_05550 [Desulfobacteraceae bacterium]|nr:hypothetical protein [Desulfobacteraceae bacterium]